MKAEWLLSQGKGRSFRLGQHHELVDYLIKTCGTNADDVRKHFSFCVIYLFDFLKRDDLHLSRIMLQQDQCKQSQLISESEFVRMSSSSSINSTNRYSEYDNRPIKPLDQNLFQSKLSEYPVEPMKSKYSAHEPSISKMKSKRHTIAEPVATVQLKSAPVNVKGLTQSVDKMRTSMLKA